MLFEVVVNKINRSFFKIKMKIMNLNDEVLEIAMDKDENGNFYIVTDYWEKISEHIASLNDLIEEFYFSIRTVLNREQLEMARKVLLYPYKSDINTIEINLDKETSQDKQREKALLSVLRLYDELSLIIEEAEKELEPSTKKQIRTFESELNESRIWLLFSLLTSNNFIKGDSSHKNNNREWKIFYTAFSGIPIEELEGKINWLFKAKGNSKTLLSYFIYQFAEEYLEQENYFSIAENYCFKGLKKGDLKAAKSNSAGWKIKPRGHKKIDEILNSLRKTFTDLHR